MDLIRRVREEIRDRQMIGKGDLVLAGVSGGADSVCLLLVLRALEEDLSFSLSAVHVHHGIREEADEDQAFTEALCRGLGVPCRSVRVRADLAAAERGIGLEEACRDLRYGVFSSLAEEMEEETGRPCRVAVAHHLEDQAETVLFNLCRGSALTGLRGMLPVSGRIIRPLLGVRRREIEAFLEERGTAWRTDRTNLDPSWSRNYLRARVLPLLRESINRETDAHIAAAAGEAAETEAYLEERTREEAAACLAPDGALLVSALLERPSLIRRRLLMEAAAAACGGRKDLTRAHIRSLEALLEGGGTRETFLPGGVRALRVYDRLLIGKEPVSSFPGGGEDYRVRLVPAGEEPLPAPENQYTKAFDYDKIASPLVFRTRQQGDRMALAGGAGAPSKSLARLMIDEKVPKEIRDRMVLPFSGRDCLWVPGRRVSPAYLPDGGTKRILVLTWSRKEV